MFGRFIRRTFARFTRTVPLYVVLVRIGPIHVHQTPHCANGNLVPRGFVFVLLFVVGVIRGRLLTVVRVLLARIYLQMVSSKFAPGFGTGYQLRVANHAFYCLPVLSTIYGLMFASGDAIVGNELGCSLFVHGFIGLYSAPWCFTSVDRTVARIGPFHFHQLP